MVSGEWSEICVEWGVVSEWCVVSGVGVSEYEWSEICVEWGVVCEW